MTFIPTEFSADDSTVLLAENKPFICRPEKGGDHAAALLVHGFTATPHEMAPLARHLAARGIPSVAVRLPGHGTTEKDLAQRSFEEWVETVISGHQFLQQEQQQIVAVGLSTGAMVALAAHLEHKFDGVVLLSPYLRIRHRLAPWAGLLRYFIHYQTRVIPLAERPYYYGKRPMEGIYQINRLIQKVKKKLSSITVPALVICSEGDQTIDPKSAVELYQQLGSLDKELHRFGIEVPHVLTAAENPKQKEIFTLVSRFIESARF